MIPYFDDGQITIYCADNVQTLEELGRDIADLTVTSPPYDNLRDYNGYSWSFDDLAPELFKATVKGGVVVWVVGDATINGSETGSSFRQALGFMECGFKLHDTMIYDKVSFRFPEENRYYPVFEYMFVLSIGVPNTTNLIADRHVKYSGTIKYTHKERQPDGSIRYPSREYKYKQLGVRHNIWHIPANGSTTTKDKNAYQHPAIFPEALARDHIISWSNEGDTILDPFNGSGTTTKMAQQQNRRAIGIELSEEYCQIAVERLSHKTAYHLPEQVKRAKPIQLSMV